MEQTEQALEWLLERLTLCDRRITPQRVAVCAAILAHNGHPTPMEIRDLVWQSNRSISQATIYNTIAMLEEFKLIRKLDIAGSEHTHYDLNVAPHINIVCKQCGRINDVHTDMIEALFGFVAARSNYEIDTGAGLIVYGICTECQQTQNSNTDDKKA